MSEDWDRFWRWEIWRRAIDPLDFRRWKADSSAALRALPAGQDRDGRPPRLLDASCGMGFHAIIQRELGFAVEACDGSALVLADAAARFEAEGVEIPTFLARWEELGVLRPARYDLIFNDEVHQVRDPAALAAILSGFRGALRPGGALVFFFADDRKPADGINQCRWDWEHRERERVAWTHRRDELEVSLTITSERTAPDGIAEHHAWTIRRDGAAPREERATMERNFCWDWDAIVPVLRDSGFPRVECHQRRNVQGWDFTMNLAFAG